MPSESGSREVKLRYCGNCGRKHWGYIEVYKGWEYTEYDFIWTSPQGEAKHCPVCHSMRDPCDRTCWTCELRAQRAMEVTDGRRHDSRQPELQTESVG